MELSKRMSAVAEFVTKGTVLADIGTDHAYIPIYLVKKGQVPRAIAMDINKGPLKKASDNIKEQGLSDQIECRLSNGLEKLSNEEADTIVIAGIGGDLITKILMDGNRIFTESKELILQPQSELFKVRHLLHEMGYQIIKERMLIEDDKFYTVMKAVKGEQKYDQECHYHYGKLLLEEKNPILFEYLTKENNTYEMIWKTLEDAKDSEHAKKRQIEVKRQSDLVKGALKYYDM